MKVTLEYDDDELKRAGITTPEQVKEILQRALSDTIGENEGYRDVSEECAVRRAARE